MNLAELDWQFVFSLVAAMGVLVAAIYHIMSLRYNMRARAMEMIYTHVSDIVSEQGIRRYVDVMNMEWKNYEDFNKKYGLSNREMFPKWGSWFLALEATGLLIKNKVVKPEMIYDLGGYGTILTWEKFKGFIQTFRKDPTWGGPK